MVELGALVAERDGWVRACGSAAVAWSTAAHQVRMMMLAVFILGAWSNGLTIDYQEVLNRQGEADGVFAEAFLDITPCSCSIHGRNNGRLLLRIQDHEITIGIMETLRKFFVYIVFFRPRGDKRKPTMPFR